MPELTPHAGAPRWMDDVTEWPERYTAAYSSVMAALTRSGNSIGKTDLRTTMLRNISHLWTPTTAPMMPMRETFRLSAPSHEEDTP